MQITLWKKHDKCQENCVPIAIYLNKMYNVLQTCPYIFLHIPKFKFFGHTSKNRSMCLGKNSMSSNLLNQEWKDWKPAF